MYTTSLESISRIEERTQAVWIIFICTYKILKIIFNFKKNYVHHVLTDQYSILDSISRQVKIEFCYSVYNQRESFIYLDLMVKNREIPIKRSFKW
jgi:hypothetical protein